MAEIPERVRMMAAYNLDNGINPADVKPEVAAAMAALEADGYWLRKQQAAAQPAMPREDRSTWPRAVHDGLSIGALICSITGFSIIAVILAAVHISNARKDRKRGSAANAWGLGLGIAGCVGWSILIIVLIAAGVAASHAGYTDPHATTGP